MKTCLMPIPRRAKLVHLTQSQPIRMARRQSRTPFSEKKMLAARILDGAAWLLLIGLLLALTTYKVLS